MRRNLAPFMFLLPVAIMFGTFVLWPISRSIYLSFFKWDGLGDMAWVGVANYVKLFTGDPDFWLSVTNNVRWLIASLLGPVLGLLLALFVSQPIAGMRAARSLFFLPFVLSAVVIGLVFSLVYDPYNGVLNTILGSVGISRFAPLSDANAATYAIIVASLWPTIAFCMVVYLTGLTNLNSEVIEAARMDGAGGGVLLTRIVLPQLSPATSIAFTVTIIGALRSFDLIAVMTKGGPYGSSKVLAYLVYEETITNYKIGYGAAIAVVLLVLTSAYTGLFLARSSKMGR